MNGGFDDIQQTVPSSKAFRETRDGGGPRWVDTVLEWQFTWIAARIALTSLFIVSAIVEIKDFPAAVAIQSTYGLYPPAFWAIVTIIVQLVGSAIVVSGRFIWVGAGMLAVFTAATDVVAHRFWELNGQARFAERNEFFEHLGLVAGFVVIALLAEDRARGRARTRAMPGGVEGPKP